MIAGRFLPELIISDKQTVTRPDILIGTSGWHYDDWRNIFYPEKLPRSKWLSFYSNHFRTVEVNATFYRKFQDRTFDNWSAQVPSDFRFVFKAPRIITHRRRLSGVDREIVEFCRQASSIGERFGLILLQLAPRTPIDPPLLGAALSSFKGCKVAVEFRDVRWLAGDTRRLLENAGAVFCAVDSPQMKINDWVTSDTAYIRLHGRLRWYDHLYTDEELDEVAGHVATMHARGARRIYIFFNNDHHGYAVKNAIALNKILAG